MEMKEQEIKQLLERYWQCETSLEEEKQLRAFFLGNDFPKTLKSYQPLFLATNQLSGIQASNELKSKLNGPSRLQLYPVLKIAASVLIILTIGIGFYTHYQQEKYMDRVFSDTYTDPEDAVRTTEQVIAKVSSVLQLMQEKSIQQEILDSLEVKELQLQEE
jgi:hypothetical protein